MGRQVQEAEVGSSKDKSVGAPLSEEQKRAIQRIKEEFGDGYYLVLLPGALIRGEPATHLVISKKNFEHLAKRARRPPARKDWRGLSGPWS